MNLLELRGENLSRREYLSLDVRGYGLSSPELEQEFTLITSTPLIKNKTCVIQ